MISKYDIICNGKYNEIKITMSHKVKDYEFHWSDGFKKKNRKDFQFKFTLKVKHIPSNKVKEYSFM